MRKGFEATEKKVSLMNDRDACKYASRNDYSGITAEFILRQVRESNARLLMGMMTRIENLRETGSSFPEFAGMTGTEVLHKLRIDYQKVKTANMVKAARG